MLSGTVLAYYAGLPHFLRHERLTDCIVYLMRTRMSKTFKFYIYLSSAQLLRCSSCIKQRSRSPDKISSKLIQFLNKGCILHIIIKCFFEFIKRTAKNFTDIFSAEYSKKAFIAFHTHIFSFNSYY